MRLLTIVGNERGVSTLETIAVLPTVLLMLFGGAELSRAWLTLNLVTTAAREAARAAVVASPTAFPNPPSAVARIDEILGAGKWTGTVTCASAPCAPDAEVRAHVEVTFQSVLPAFLPMIAAVPIQQTVVMRFE